MTVLDTLTRTIEAALDHASETSNFRWPQQEDVPPIADAVIVAIRAMPVKDQAELLKGHLTRDANGEAYVVSYGGER